MHVTVVEIEVKPEHVEEFIAATRANHEGSIRENGNRRFDVLQFADDPTRFLLYEVYATVEAAAAHKTTAHYLAWRDRVAPWMASRRKGIACRALCPEDPSLW
jgi:autoinducer 2-degrading protein